MSYGDDHSVKFGFSSISANADRRGRVVASRFGSTSYGRTEAVDANLWAAEAYFQKHQQFTKPDENATSALTYNTHDAAAEVGT